MISGAFPVTSSVPHRGHEQAAGASPDARRPSISSRSATPPSRQTWHPTRCSAWAHGSTAGSEDTTSGAPGSLEGADQNAMRQRSRRSSP
ncbi:hypothetical protein GCM10011609_60110 [Lentzea pudingi]|uniref:Uncharacterized protein n=1 Tax=Lentzea pudingi TaxID=1789439 RepID=A0ABQ2IJA7_9PSEU|nr:hypothetical protein [Lentzea pudingi]GGN11931.1 hypothetical protein GCM10011609_60110 [Lentzea pudingi]